MKDEIKGNHYMNAMIKERIWTKSKGNLRFQNDFLWKEIDFKGKRVLDIGGGSGLLSIYAACQGAKYVICIDPEGPGSSNGVNEKFLKASRSLELNNISLKQVTLQSFESDGMLFDIIIMYNSINHLDETACINLLSDESSKSIYRGLFSKIYDLSDNGAKLIICDMSRNNFFSLLKIKNPFAPTIEWHKHQAPEVWAKFLSEIGYRNPVIRWSSFNSLRSLGSILFGNKLMSYFLSSHFCLTMKKV
jgi:SAM-dependent methyltransferase